MSIHQILERLDKVQKIGPQKWKASCPSHSDSTPSLYLTELSDGRILVKDFGGCGACDVMASIGLSLSDLFPDGKLGEYKSFQTIENDMQIRKEEKEQDKLFRDRALLLCAEGKRNEGERLTPEEMELERQAFLRVRNADSK